MVVFTISLLNIGYQTLKLTKLGVTDPNRIILYIISCNVNKTIFLEEYFL